MRVLIVYDTAFGNTEAIARAIGSELADAADVTLASARSDEPTPERPDLLVVGGPTQRRRASAELRSALDRLGGARLRGVQAAAFDTRYRMPRLLSGSAGAEVRSRLAKAGCRLIAETESFFVERDLPPRGHRRRHQLERLEPGEVERASAWARRLLASGRRGPG